MKEYKHTQYGYVVLVFCGAALIWLAYINIITNFHSWVVGGFFFMILIISLFGSLRVTVDSEKIKIKFGIGVVKKTFSIDDIDSCEVVRNRWYYGWGIRYTPHGWLYNVSGLSAIELHMKGGKKYRIGTDDSKGLLQAIRTAIKPSRVH